MRELAILLASLQEHDITDGTELFNLSRLRAKIKVHRIFIGEMFFAHVNTQASHIDENLQKVMNIFSTPETKFGLTTSIKKTNVMGQDVTHHYQST